jgi:hypothetical protein
MNQPKAKWSYDSDGDFWDATVGPFYLQIFTGRGTAELYDRGWKGLWSSTLQTPCDVVDLMRLAEDELARRLHSAADTMDGDELVASATVTPTAPSGAESTVTVTNVVAEAAAHGWESIMVSLGAPLHVGSELKFDPEIMASCKWDHMPLVSRAAVTIPCAHPEKAITGLGEDMFGRRCAICGKLPSLGSLFDDETAIKVVPGCDCAASTPHG